MSDASDHRRPQTPADLSADLADELRQAMPPELLRQLEPETLFSTEITWRRTKSESRT